MMHGQCVAIPGLYQIPSNICALEADIGSWRLLAGNTMPCHVVFFSFLFRILFRSPNSLSNFLQRQTPLDSYWSFSTSLKPWGHIFIAYHHRKHPLCNALLSCLSNRFNPLTNFKNLLRFTLQLFSDIH